MKRFMDFFDENRNLFKKIGAVIAIIVILLAVKGIMGNDPQDKEQVDDIIAAEAASGNIYVDIGGAVISPMLAELPQGSRVDDAINAAGGVTKDADLSSINRAEFLEDGQKIFIPTYIEEGDLEEGYITGSSDYSSSGKVNINTADATALQTLNGVGPATAQKIIDYRNTVGRFKSADELMNVSGIGDKTYEKLKDYITV